MRTSTLPWQPKKPIVPWIHQAQHCHQTREGVVPLCSEQCGLTSSTECSLGATTYEGDKTVREPSKEGYEDGEAARVQGEYGQCCHILGFEFWVILCVEPMVRLSGPQGFPPTQGIAHQLHCQKGAEVCLNWYKIFFEVKLIDLLNLALFCQ